VNVRRRSRQGRMWKQIDSPVTVWVRESQVTVDDMEPFALGERVSWPAFKIGGEKKANRWIRTN
jgi:hypothetical protein